MGHGPPPGGAPSDRAQRGPEGGLGGPELVVDLLDDVTQGEEDVEEAVNEAGPGGVPAGAGRG